MITVRYPLAVAVASAGLLLFMTIERPCHGDEPLPLIDQEPFDRITLTPDQDGTQLLVFPLADEGTQVPANPQPTDKLRLRLLDHPDTAFEIEFRYVAKIEQFADLLLAAANSLVERGEFDEAFTYYQYLQRESAQLAGLSAAIEDFLLRNAAAAFRQSRLREAMGLLIELQQRNPRRRQLQAAVKSVATRLFQQDVDRQEYAQARRTMNWVRQQFLSQRLESLLVSWQKQLEAVSDEQLQAARQLMSAGDWRAARQAAEVANAARPQHGATLSLLREISESHPVLVVGVWQTAPRLEDAVPLEWNSRRQARLLSRPLVEQMGFGSDGGRYGSPWGDVAPAASGDSLRFRLNLPPQASDRVTVFDVSRRFLDRRLADHSLAARAFARITVSNPSQLVLDLHAPTLRPEYWLTEPFTASVGSTALFSWSRPYLRQPEAEDSRERHYFVNPDYLLANARMFREVHERRLADPAQLVRGLIDGKLDLVARLHPADIRALQRQEAVQMANYACPTLHFLLPNLQRPLAAHRMIRRGLLYGLDREAILAADVLGGASVRGARVLNGPFPFGVSLDDPVAYAVDTQIPTRAFDPLLGLTLYRFAASEIIARERAKQPPSDDRPSSTSADRVRGEESSEAFQPSDPLVVMYPDQARARVSVDAIRRYWSAVGIAVTTQVLSEDAPLPRDSSWDFCYVELTMTEPLYDIQRLLGEFGLVPEVSAYLRLAMRQLRESSNWEEARRELYEIHRLVHEELPLIPLWQVPETMAYRRTVSGIPRRPITLYQDIESWRQSTP